MLIQSSPLGYKEFQHWGILCSRESRAEKRPAMLLYSYLESSGRSASGWLSKECFICQKMLFPHFSSVRVKLFMPWIFTLSAAISEFMWEWGERKDSGREKQVINQLFYLPVHLNLHGLCITINIHMFVCNPVVCVCGIAARCTKSGPFTFPKIAFCFFQHHVSSPMKMEKFSNSLPREAHPSHHWRLPWCSKTFLNVALTAAYIILLIFWLLLANVLTPTIHGFVFLNLIFFFSYISEPRCVYLEVNLIEDCSLMTLLVQSHPTDHNCNWYTIWGSKHIHPKIKFCGGSMWLYFFCRTGVEIPHPSFRQNHSTKTHSQSPGGTSTPNSCTYTNTVALYIWLPVVWRVAIHP